MSRSASSPSKLCFSDAIVVPWLLIIPLILYTAGLFVHCRYIGRFDWGAAVLLGLLAFLVPPLGLATFFAGLAAIVYFANNRALYFSGTDLFLVLALLGVLSRLILDRTSKSTSLRSAAIILGLIIFFAVTPLFHFWDLSRWYPADIIQMLWIHLYHSDQMSPFAFIYRSWIYALGVILFFVIRLQNNTPFSHWLTKVKSNSKLLSSDIVLKKQSQTCPQTTPRFEITGADVIYWGLISGGVVLAAVSAYDVVGKGAKLLSYHIIFDERNTFAAFWVLQVGLLADAWVRPQRRTIKRIKYCLLVLFSLLLFASLSLSGIGTWVILVLGSVLVLGKPHVLSLVKRLAYRRYWSKLLVGFLILYLLFPSLSLIYPPADPLLFAEQFGKRLRSLAPHRVFETLRSIRAFSWAAGWEMFRDSPLFGVGIGTFYKLSGEYLSRPSIKQLEGHLSYQNENAHNYFLQLAAETGLAGLALFLWPILWLLWRYGFRGADKNTAVCIAIIGLLLMSVTGHPLLVNEIFYIFCALLALMAQPLEKPFAIRRRQKKWALVAGVISMLFFALHLSSIWNKLPHDFEWGFYQTEDEAGKPFRWTRGFALKRVTRSELKQIALRAHNPDIARDPLTVEVKGDRQLVTRAVLKDREWHTFAISSQAGLPSAYVLAIRASRTWSPATLGIAADHRQLGVAVRIN